MKSRKIAYFTMEVALEASIPTYSGGLGGLAGDTLRSAADLEVPMVAVTLVHRRGYFDQHLDAEGRQTATEVVWSPEERLQEERARVSVTLEGREVTLRAWRYDVRGAGGFRVPVYLLDADLPENAEPDRHLTHHLYGGDDRYRLCQEAILGLGGVRMLRALGYRSLEKWHMNEGHAALLTLELLHEQAGRAGRPEITGSDIEAVREQCVFTNHTPVPAGHDQFPLELVRQVLGEGSLVLDREDVFCVDVWTRILQAGEPHAGLEELASRGLRLNMTYLALNLSSYVNGVAKKHGEVARLMFAGYAVDAITNGVHAVTWATEPFAALFDRHVPGWRQDNFALRAALAIRREEIWDAHRAAKDQLLAAVRERTGTELDPHVLTLGFARRAATYKRADLLFEDLHRLRHLARDHGGLQVVYAGKAHPQDEDGQQMIQRVFEAKAALAPDVEVVYLENYDTDLARRIAGGSDLWLNTPQPPNEASGTSGMKAALNGVPSLSILDGWWLEGHIEDVTGWSIGEDADARSRDHDATALYDKLEKKIIPAFYGSRHRYLDVMRHAIALNGSFFNTQRMVQQYVVRAYLD